MASNIHTLWNWNIKTSELRKFCKIINSCTIQSPHVLRSINNCIMLLNTLQKLDVSVCGRIFCRSPESRCGSLHTAASFQRPLRSILRTIPQYYWWINLDRSTIRRSNYFLLLECTTIECVLLDPFVVVLVHSFWPQKCLFKLSVF